MHRATATANSSIGGVGHLGQETAPDRSDHDGAQRAKILGHLSAGEVTSGTATPVTNP